MAKNTNKNNDKNKNTINKFQDMLNKSTECVITVTSLTDATGKALAPDVAKIVGNYKTSTWEFAKVCYYFNKVKGIKVETLAGLMDVSYQNISKHANNVAYMLETFGKGCDSYADKYSVSKIDLIRKAKEAGRYKKDKFEDLINKKRSALEKAVSGGDNSGDKDEPVKTFLIRMINTDNEEITRPVPVDTWKKWVEEFKKGQAE